MRAPASRGRKRNRGTRKARTVRRFIYAAAAASLLLLGAVAAIAQTAGGTPTMDKTQLIMLMVGSASSLIIGWITKKYTAVPNGLIPLINGALATLAFATIGGLGFTYEALVTGMAAAYMGIAAYEGSKSVKPGAAAGIFAAVMLLVAGNARASTDTQLLRPYWTGPVWGAFTNAQPDSIQGAKAELQVPIGVRLTNPITFLGQNWTVRAQFKWTTKAYLDVPSEPLRDATYEWFPGVRAEPDSAAGFWRYTDIGPDHISNGEDGSLSRSMNGVSAESAFVWNWAGISFDAYLKVWYVYDFGENTAPLSDAISLFDDLGAKVLVRCSLSMLQVAAELGPDWQKAMAYVPLNDFYHFGFYGEFYNGEANSFLNPTISDTVGKIGVALEPPHL